MRFSYLLDGFEYCLKKYDRPKTKFEMKPRSTLFSEGAMQSHVDVVTISTNYPPSPHQTGPPLPSDAEDHAHTPVHLSHPPNITSLNFGTDLVVSPSSCHMNFVPQLYIHTRLFLHMILSCVLPFRTLHML